LPAAAIAARLIDPVRQAGADGLLFIARNERQAEEIAVSAKQFLPAAQVILLPPWDCLPYDRVRPSRESMGRRAAALEAMASPCDNVARLVVSSPEAALQRVLPADVTAQGFTTVSAGQPLEGSAFRDRLSSCGYLLDDRVDEPGEFAIQGQVIDVFSPDAFHPYRIQLDDGMVAGILSYDPLTQLTDVELPTVVLAPAWELPVQAAETTQDRAQFQNIETEMLAAGHKLETVFRLVPDATVMLEPATDDRFDSPIALIDEARLARDRQQGRKPTDERFYLDRASLKAAFGKRRACLDVSGLSAVPAFITQPNPAAAAADFVEARAAAGMRVVLAGSANELERLRKAVRRLLKQDVGVSGGWAEVVEGEPGSLVSLDVDLDAGFVDEVAGIAVISVADVFGTRLAARSRAVAGLADEPELRIGDVVLHEDHGIAVLRALETVDVGGLETDTVRLEYHGGATLLAPVEEFGRIWRYGAEEGAVTLDRLKGDGWTKRRAQLDDEIEEAAHHLVALAKEREKQGARVLKAPRGSYARFAARFPYPETADQSAAIADVIADLSSGRAMNRLVCGDVGFGKTEVALRAAAIAALNGGQVAVVAPTTVLARQHFETFSRRFEGTDAKVALLSRVVGNAEAKTVKAGLKDGSIRIVVGTHAIAGKDVGFADLALLIIDEEHRFGTKLKQQLRDLAPGLHVLSMSATPIPRTLAGAMAGVQESSLLATPPARRRPVRTELAPFDAVSVKTALVREHRRGGQSFCVVPRIEDIEPTLSELRSLVPDMSILVAHGDMDAAEMEDAMVRFANGEGNILLSTNIIETGLDVPRANTIIVLRADRFGLAQLHQLRGRVGRGRAQGSAYLLTEAGKEIDPDTRSRLSTLLAFDRLGSGLAISARDLDLRGAGDLVGEEQAGHMKLIGVSLYQRLLGRAVDKARGNARHSLEPEIQLGVSGSFPNTYVSEPVVRLNLYSRLLRLQSQAEIDAFADEIEDRFGPPPPETISLVDLARLKLAAAGAGISKIGAGPDGIALTFAKRGSLREKHLKKRPDCAESNGRLIFRIATGAGPERLVVARELVSASHPT
jgi:transcription-repair coupling factor (superfamily II helicase)